jgi:hypothetical protein
VIGRFMRAMAEAARIMHVDREYTYKVLGKYLRVDDRKLLEASYNVEIKALEPRLAMKPEGFQSTLDEIAPTEPRAKAVKPQDMMDSRYRRDGEAASSSRFGGRSSVRLEARGTRGVRKGRSLDDSWKAKIAIGNTLPGLGSLKR